MSRLPGARPRLRAVRALLAATLTTGLVTAATPAAARPAPAAALPTRALPAQSSDPAIGGELLGRRGVVVDRRPGAPALPAVSAAGWLVADAGTGEVLAARNAHGTFLPASTLKTLTAVALLRRLSVDGSFLATHSCVNIEGSRVGLVEGMRYTHHALFESLLMVSGNDSANCLAEAAGGMAAAVRAMNEEAVRLQARDTLARNTSGLDAPGQVSSPYDLALIARAGLAMPKFAEYVGRLRSSMPAPGGRRFETYNHNKLLTRYRGTIGVKNGYTIKARHTYIGAARRGDRTLVVTLMKAESKYEDAMRLFDWGFAAAGKTLPIGRLVDPLPEEADHVEPADRSRTTVDAVPRAAGLSVPATGGRRVPLAPAAGGGVALLGVLVGLRRRAVRRRRAYGASGGLRLKLPVR